jgi:hypothetical protein
VLLRTEIHVLLIAFANIGVVIAVDEYQDQWGMQNYREKICKIHVHVLEHSFPWFLCCKEDLHEFESLTSPYVILYS